MLPHEHLIEVDADDNLVNENINETTSEDTRCAPTRSLSARIASARFHQTYPPKFPYGVSDSTLGPFFEYPVGVLELNTTDGACGYGLLPVGRVAAEILEHIFLPLVFESAIDLTHIESFWLRCQARIRNIGAGYTHHVLAGIDIALWDLAAKYACQPLYQLLGARRSHVTAYGSNGWTNHDEPQLLNGMTQLAARGFTTLKMKVGVSGGTQIKEDVRRVRAVRKAIGRDIALAVDANQCWTAQQALDFAFQLADENIAWFEEPINAHDFLGYKQLTAQSPIKIAAGECLTNHFAFETLDAINALDIFQPELTRIGGITGYRRVARLAAQHQRQVISGGFAHLICTMVAASETGVLSEYLVPFMDSFDKLWASKPQLVKGAWHLSNEDGHGLTPDFDFVNRYRQGEPLVFVPRDASPITAY